MTNVTGRPLKALTGLPLGRAVSLGLNGPWDAARRAWGISRVGVAAACAHGPLSFATTSAVGRIGPGPGADLWERIIVSPRKKEVGFIFSDQVWFCEVWSTFKRPVKPLANVMVTGPGGATAQGPVSMIYFPGQSQIYSINLPADGSATIANLITWIFPGLAGADLAVNGSRVILFPYRPDWSEPVRVTPSWLTEILPGYDGAEQRRPLRKHPRCSLVYRVQTVDPLETASLEGLLYGWQARQFGVPVWPDATPLLGDLVPGATALSADTVNRPGFKEGGLVMIWSSFSLWEVFEMGPISSGSVSLGSQVTRYWPAGARVVPVFRGRLQADQPLGRPTNWLSVGSFSFTCEAV